MQVSEPLPLPPHLLAVDGHPDYRSGRGTGLHGQALEGSAPQQRHDNWCASGAGQKMTDLGEMTAVGRHVRYAPNSNSNPCPCPTIPPDWVSGRAL